MKRLFLILLTIMCLTFTACNSNNTSKPSIEYLTIDLSLENYLNYIEFVPIEITKITDNEEVSIPCVVIKSKLYDEGWVYFNGSNRNFDFKWNETSFGSNTVPFGYRLENVFEDTIIEPINITGSYTFVKKSYISEYIYEPGYRLVVLIDGQFSEEIYSQSLIDYSYPF